MNWMRLWAAVIFFYHQNQYFGWHLTPGSDAELIADGLTILLFSLAFSRKCS